MSVTSPSVKTKSCRKKKDIHQVSVKFVFKTPESALKKPNYQPLGCLETGRRSLLIFCHLHRVLTWFAQEPGNVHRFLLRVSSKASVARHKKVSIVHSQGRGIRVNARHLFLFIIEDANYISYFNNPTVKLKVMNS